MKKDTKEGNSGIVFTETSIQKINQIISKMDGNTFHNHYHILYDICDSISHDNIVYLEIGTYAGASASLVASNPKVKKVISVDIGTPVDKSIPIKNVNFFKNTECDYVYVEGNSSDKNILAKVRLLIDSVDILFIDGNHLFDGVLSDFNNYSQMVKSGGYIVFDDYLDTRYSPGVRFAVDHIVKNLKPNSYEIIGSIHYELINKTNLPHFMHSNEFILKKL